MVMPAQKPGRSKQDYQTPLALLDAVRGWLEIDQFSLDLAASAENAVCPRYFTEADNALSCAWVDALGLGWAWLNPPFAQMAPWVEKAYRESQQGLALAMLVPAGVGSNWWRDWVHDKCRVLLLNGRVTFVGETTCYPKDCCVLIYHPQVAVGYEVWSWQGRSRDVR